MLVFHDNITDISTFRTCQRKMLMGIKLVTQVTTPQIILKTIDWVKFDLIQSLSFKLLYSGVTPLGGGILKIC